MITDEGNTEGIYRTPCALKTLHHIKAMAKEARQVVCRTESAFTGEHRPDIETWPAGVHRNCIGLQRMKMYVGNLAFSVTDGELENLFSACGTVKSAQVITDRDSGRSKGFGFVEMSSASEAEAAIDKFDGYELSGRSIKVNKAKPGKTAPPGPDTKSISSIKKGVGVSPAPCRIQGSIRWPLQSNFRSSCRSPSWLLHCFPCPGILPLREGW